MSALFLTKYSCQFNREVQIYQLIRQNVRLTLHAMKTYGGVEV
jgi:hypothetical protein